jgi:branched-chain amino acid transport system ATP-binding protein
MPDTILKSKNLTKEFGELVAVDHLDIAFSDDEICAVIGPNGAGKTTLFNLLCGVLSPSEGTITYKGNDITSLSVVDTARQGLVRSYQTANLFQELTVSENVRTAAQQNYSKYNFWKSIEDIPGLSQDVSEILQFLRLADVGNKEVSELSHGERRTLEIAVALGSEPDMILMDEPTSGISPEETEQITNTIEKIAADIPVVVVEHKMSVVRRVADRIVVLHNGQKLAEGPPEQIRDDERVREVYLQEETV